MWVSISMGGVIVAQSVADDKAERDGGELTEGSPAQSSDSEAAITLGLLDAVHQNSEVSQRRLSSELGIALGLTNAYLRRCVRKGWVKMKAAPANRYAYYLTPKGFAEKSRLTAGYLSRSLSFYREARNECDALLEECGKRDWTRIALYGAGDLAEMRFSVPCVTQRRSLALYSQEQLNLSLIHI